MSPEEQQVFDAALIWYERYHDSSALSREEWYLIQAVEGLPNARIQPVWG